MFASRSRLPLTRALTVSLVSGSIMRPLALRVSSPTTVTGMFRTVDSPVSLTLAVT